MFRVAITDYTFPDLEIETAILQAAGCQVISGQCKTPESIIELVRDVDAVITQFAPVNEDVVASLQNAQVIVRYGVGFDNVACDAARARGIPVCNIPTFCIDEVADHTLGFILGATRQVRANCQLMVRGEWGLAVPLLEMKSLANLTVGIIGFGRIGQAVAHRLQGFGCQILAMDPQPSPAAIAAAGAEQADLDTLLQQSDVVSLHCPTTPDTRKIINVESLKKMKTGAILINVGRGELVDLDALTAAVLAGKLGAVALDVFDPEPLPADHPLLPLDNVLVSSHIASASVSAVRTLRETAAQLVVMKKNGEPLPSIVNGVTE